MPSIIPGQPGFNLGFPQIENPQENIKAKEPEVKLLVNSTNEQEVN